MPCSSPTLPPYTTLFRSGRSRSKTATRYAWLPAGMIHSVVASDPAEPANASARIAPLTRKRTARPPSPHRIPHVIPMGMVIGRDRKSTRLNSSHLVISYAVLVAYTPSLHDALPIWAQPLEDRNAIRLVARGHDPQRRGQRSSGACERQREDRALDSKADSATAQPTQNPPRDTDGNGDRKRSEEHTSELQSPCNLVCRARRLHSLPTRRSSDLGAAARRPQRDTPGCPRA